MNRADRTFQSSLYSDICAVAGPRPRPRPTGWDNASRHHMSLDELALRDLVRQLQGCGLLARMLPLAERRAKGLADPRWYLLVEEIRRRLDTLDPQTP